MAARRSRQLRQRPACRLHPAIQRPVRYLISSTFHDNYTGGNVAYQDVIRIGHENYKADLLDLMKTDNVPAAQQANRLAPLDLPGRRGCEIAFDVGMERRLI